MFTPEEKQAWQPEPCSAYENKILDLQHGQLAAPARQAAEAHMAECPACRQFAEELQSLDVALTTEFQGKVLPASFKMSLLSRIDAAAADAAPDVIVRRKAAIESEFQSQSAGLLRRVVRDNSGLFLEAIGLGTLAIVFALLAQKFASGGLGASATMPRLLSGLGGTYLLWAGAAVSVTSALWLGLRERVRRVMP